MITKGGITGLPENDFYKRQKSGDWSIDEHFENINYIRTKSHTPNNYLAVGCYESDEILIYDIFNNQISSLTKPISGTDSPSISCIAYNRNVGHLAIGQNKAPFLRIFDTEDIEMPEFVPLGNQIQDNYLTSNPVFIQRFRQGDLVDNVLKINHNFDDLTPAVYMLSVGPNISYPYEIEIVDPDHVNIIFFDLDDNISGIVYIHSYEKNSVHLLEHLPSETIDDYTSYHLDLINYNHINPIFQLYDSANKMFFPKNIVEIVENTTYDIILPTDFDSEDIKILVVQGHTTYTEEFSITDIQTSVEINHSLASKYLAFQMFDKETGEVVYPENIHIDDNDNITISTDGLLVSKIYKINISKSPPVFGKEELLVSDPPTSMVTCLEFDTTGDKLIVGTLESQDEIKKDDFLIKKFKQSNLNDNVLRITHNLRDFNPAVYMYSEDSSISYPHEVELIDENTIDIVFINKLDNPSGIVHIHSYEKNTTHMLNSLSNVSTIGNDYTSYRLNLSNYDHTNVVFQIYDSDRKMIIPNSIEEIVKDEIYDISFPNDFNPVKTTVLVIQGADTYLETFIVDSDYTPILINHTLHSKYLCFQVFDTATGLTVYPSNINMIDEDNISISTDNLIVSRTYKVHIVGMIKEQDLNSIDSNIIEFDTSNYIRFPELELLKTTPTTIKTDLGNNYLFVGHYNNPPIDRNVTLYDYQTKKILDIYDFTTLKENTIDSITDSCFVDTYRLLIFGSHYTPFLHFYDFIQKENVTIKYSNIIAGSIISRVTNIIKTNDDKYILIAIDTIPYLFVLDLEQNDINALTSEYFVSSFTSLSLSVNDTYLCVTQRDDPNINVFEFTPTTLTPIDINYTPNSTPLSSKFFFGPVNA